MRNIVLSSLLLLAVGCGRSSQPTWVAADLQENDATISLGYQVEKSDQGKQIVPVAKVTDGDSPMADAMVFVTPLLADGTQVGEEAPTRFTSDARGKNPVYRAEGFETHTKEHVPQKLRFRIVTPEGEVVKEVDVGEKA